MEVHIESYLRESFTKRECNWGRIISMLKRSFDEWATWKLRENGFEEFKMAYMPFLMNIHPDGETTTDLAIKARVTKQAMHKVMKELIKMDLITMSQNEIDKRKQMIYLTERGKYLVYKSKMEVEGLVKSYGDFIEPADFEITIRTLNKILKYHHNNEKQ
jgi:DNA-binding MarR family transcriptional regulator